jgi:hypothetical protein
MQRVFTAKQSRVKGGRAALAAKQAKRKLLRLGFESVDRRSGGSPDGSVIGNSATYRKGVHQVIVSLDFGVTKECNRLSIHEEEVSI